MTSGVLFEYDAVLHAHRGETLLVEACVEDTCDNVRVTRHDRRHAMVVAPDLIKDDTPVAVTLTISSPSGDIAFQGRRTVHPVKSQPNGPDCPPTAWFAQVYASGTDNLPERGPYSD